ncbi:MATE efflux family protein [Streptococcus pneumoniae GA41410]|nr:MATE efflux family protein [Streptococcus pneumoniae GA41410]
MYKTKCLREKLVLFLKIFFPILIYQFANYSASFVDTAMTGQYNTMDLAGVSMATSIWNPFFTFLTGIVSALVPIIGHHLGRGKKEEVASDFYQFIYLALGLSVVLLGMVLFLAPTILNHIGLEAAVAAVAVRYLWFLSIGIIPLLLFSVIRSLLDSLGLTKLSMYLMLLLLPLNSGFNYLLIYGAFGVPELGGAGAGLGTSLAYWVLLGISVLVLFKQEKLKALHLEKRIPLNMDNIKEGVRLGLPIGGTVFAEVAIFSVVGLIMAKFSSLIIASHQSAMNFSSLMYAFPMSISSAMAIVVSYEVGAKRFDDAKTYIGLGRWTALIFAAFTLTFLYIFRGNVASLYGNDPKFIDLTARFLTYSLFFQLADTFAAPLQGILRGYKDTVIPFTLVCLVIGA